MCSQHLTLSISACFPNSLHLCKSYFQLCIKLKADPIVAAVYAALQNSLGLWNNCSATKWHFIASCLNTTFWQAQSWHFLPGRAQLGRPCKLTHLPLYPGLTQCSPAEGISEAFFKIFVHFKIYFPSFSLWYLKHDELDTKCEVCRGDRPPCAIQVI